MVSRSQLVTVLEGQTSLQSLCLDSASCQWGAAVDSVWVTEHSLHS